MYFDKEKQDGEIKSHTSSKYQESKKGNILLLTDDTFKNEIRENNVGEEFIGKSVKSMRSSLDGFIESSSQERNNILNDRGDYQRDSLYDTEDYQRV